MAPRKLWGLASIDQCNCGTTQTMSHLLECLLAPTCIPDNLSKPTDEALNSAKYVSKGIKLPR